MGASGDLGWLDSLSPDVIHGLDAVIARTPDKGSAIEREYYNMIHSGYRRVLLDKLTPNVSRGFKFVAIAKTVTLGRLSGRRKPPSNVEVLGRIR